MRALTQPVRASADDDREHGDQDAYVVGHEHDDQQREQRADGEGDHRGPGRVPRVGQVVGVDAELDLGVGAERVVGGELGGHELRGLLA